MPHLVGWKAAIHTYIVNVYVWNRIALVCSGTRGITVTTKTHLDHFGHPPRVVHEPFRLHGHLTNSAGMKRRLLANHYNVCVKIEGGKVQKTPAIVRSFDNRRLKKNKHIVSV